MPDSSSNPTQSPSSNWPDKPASVWIVRAVIYMFAASAFAFVTTDPDLWGHIRFGGESWGLKGPAATDSYSYTAFGLPWVNHEWITEIIFFLIYRAFDSTGLLVLKFLLGIVIIHLLSNMVLKKSDNIWAYLIHFSLLIPVMAPGFMVRPHLATFLFLTLLMVILHKYFDGNRKTIFWVAPLMLAWVNCHGGVLAGLGIFGLVVTVEEIRGWIKERKIDSALLGALALSGVAVLINPYGYKLWTFFAYTLGTSRPINEWEAVPLLSLSYLPLKIMALLFLATFLFPTRKRIWEVLIIFAALLYGFKHQRHSVLAMIVMTPYLPLQLAEISQRLNLTERSKKLFIRLRLPLYILCGLFILWHMNQFVQRHRLNGYNMIVKQMSYPSYAAQFLEANQIDGNIMTPFDWGEYILWKRPRSKVFVDGRFRTVYPEKVLKDSWNFRDGNKQWRSALDNYPTDLVLTNRYEPGHKLLRKAPDWQMIYMDLISAIFIRKTDPPSDLLKKFKEQKLIYPETKPPFFFPG